MELLELLITFLLDDPAGFSKNILFQNFIKPHVKPENMLHKQTIICPIP